MIQLLRDILGTVPAGMEFLEYIFGFVLVVFGLFIVAYIAHLPLEFIRDKMKK